MDNIRLDNYSFNNNYTMYRVDSIESTNDFFKANYALFKDKDCLVAKKQTKGRGRYNRVWTSSDDVLFSILFKKKHNNTIIAPMAVCLALRDIGINAGIKWPNDVYVDFKKICGILIEDEYKLDFEASIVGIGLNMYSKESLDVPGVLDYATIGNDQLIDLILNHYDILINTNPLALIHQYQELSIILNHKFNYKGKVYEAVRITGDGYLVGRCNDEEIIIKSDEIDIKSALVL